MSNTTRRRYLVVGVLIAVLATAGAAPASARDLNSAGSAWLWLQDFWTQGVSSLWGWHGREVPSPGRASGLVPIVAKEGPGLDPNGSPTSPRPNAATPDLDPNG
jgi:hypothetical protein